MNKRFLQKLVGDIRVVVAVSASSDDQELDEHIAEAMAMDRKVRAVLVLAVANAQLTARERARMARSGLFAKPGAVLTASALARGVLTAIRWLGASTTAGFAPDHFDEACAFLEIPPPMRREIRQEMDAMEAVLEPPNRSKEADPEGALDVATTMEKHVRARVDRIRRRKS